MDKQREALKAEIAWPDQYGRAASTL